MTEKDEALRELSDAGVLEALRWAYRATYARVLEDYDEHTGHDQGWIGYTGHKLLCDRLNRVFATAKYSVKSADEENAGLDVLAAGIGQAELTSMPRMASNAVIRDDISGSPGWRFGRWSWLLASFPFGGSEGISWNDKSRTKRRVASQLPPDQLILPFDELDMPEAAASWAEAMSRGRGVTLVAAHAIDPFSGNGELVLGHPRLSDSLTSPWYWKVDILKEGPGGGGDVRPVEPQMPTGPKGPQVPDAPVRLRRGSAEDGPADAIG